VLGVELSEESVMLKGNAEALNNITSIDVGPIDISGATDDISTSVDLTGYLPDGVFIVNSYKTKLSIDIKVETNATSTMTLNSSNITYDGLEDGYTLTFVTDKSSVVVSGTQSDIDTLSGTTLKGKIDVTGLDAGTHTVTVKPNLDETKYTWGEIKVQIVIGRKGDGGGTTGTDGTGTASGSITGGTTSGNTGSGSTGAGGSSSAGTSSGSTSSGNTGNNGSDSSSH
jgi:YbbR domain-containing protein